MDEMEEPTRPTVTCAKPGRRYLSQRNTIIEEHCNIEEHHYSPTRPTVTCAKPGRRYLSQRNTIIEEDVLSCHSLNIRRKRCGKHERLSIGRGRQIRLLDNAPRHFPPSQK